MSTRLEALPAGPEDPEIVVPPCDLPSVEPEMESHQHLLQMLLLIECLQWRWRDRGDFFASGNLTIYFSPQQIKSQDLRGPDFFVVLGTDPHPRQSWVVWAEGGRYPNFIVEILSRRTAAIDRGTKKQIYQDIFRTPEYILFDPDTRELIGFYLVDGVYQPITPDASGRLWSRQLELALGVHDGQLRYFTADGALVPTPGEAARTATEAARTATEAARTATEAARTAEDRAARLARKLSELGVDPDRIS